MNNILLVEDETNLAEAIILNLELEGYQSTWITNGNLALQTILSSPKKFNLIILDVMLPEKDGLTICKKIRAQKISTPILFLSARNSTSDKVLGLKAGGNDYLGKPFDLEEFLLRVKNLISIQSTIQSEVSFFEFKNNSIDINEFKGTNFRGKQIVFSKREIEIFKVFISQPNTTIDRQTFIDQLDSDSINPRTIDNTIVKFRRFFEADLKKPKHFISVRGVGYRFEIN